MSEPNRRWARKNYRKQAGWPDHMLDAPPEKRTKRDALYHKTVDMIYANPKLTSRDIANEFGVSPDVVTSALTSRRTNMTELRAEAMEEVRV